MDFDVVLNNGVSLLVLAMSVIQFGKVTLKLEGQRATVFAVAISFVFMLAYQAGQFMPDVYAQAYEAIMISVAFAMAVPGGYKLLRAVTE